MMIIEYLAIAMALFMLFMEVGFMVMCLGCTDDWFDRILILVLWAVITIGTAAMAIGIIMKNFPELI